MAELKVYIADTLLVEGQDYVVRDGIIEFAAAFVGARYTLMIIDELADEDCARPKPQRHHDHLRHQHIRNMR